MSTTIDSKVVEMRFDNRHFEQNVSTTMSTLDKLKAKLGFDGATKGLESINSAASKTNLAPLANGVETISAKFSAMQVVAVTALANIANSAVNAGKRMLSALTIQPVTTGFNEYELKMDSIKTIMASTGEEVEVVNKYLSELNEYSDQTIYSFADMTQNIGKFTNAGVKLEDAVAAIKGISNEAAVSGANANEASRAMYNFAQALSAGYVKLIDWKSIENANMATVEFKQQLIETAVAAGTLTDAGDGMYRTLSGKTLSATQNFNDTLQEQWMTSEVLIETLKDYADENTEIGKKAKAAAQDVTKLSQVFDILKETAQSGWAQTWELIVGNIDQAKALLTPLTNFLSGIIDAMSDARNRVLQIALDFTAPFRVVSEKLGNVKKVVSEVGKAVKPLEYFQEVVNKVWRGDYNNRGDNPDRYDLLKAAGYDHRVVQDLVNLGYRHKITIEEVEASHKKFGLTMEDTAEQTKEVTETFEELSEEQLINSELTEDEIKLYEALQKEADRAGVSISDLIEEMSNTTGRDLLVESVTNLGDLIVGAGAAIKEAWIEIFNPPSLEEMGIRLYGLIRSFKEFTKTLRLTDPETGELNDNGIKLIRTFKGIFAALDIVLTVVGGPLKIVLKLITQLLGAFGFNILDVTAWIGDLLVKFRDWIDKSLDFTKAFEKIAKPIKNAIVSFRDWIDALKESENLPKDIADGIASGFGKVFNAVKNFCKKLPEYLANGFKGLDDTPLGPFIEKLRNGLKFVGQILGELGKKILEKVNGFLSARGMRTISEDSIAGLINGFKDGASKVWNTAVEMVKTLVERVKDFLGIHSPSTVFAAIGGFIIAGLIAGLQNGIPDSLGAVKDIFQPMLDWINNIDWGTIFAGGLGVGFLLVLNKFADALSVFKGLDDVFEGAGLALAGIGKAAKSLSKKFLAEALKEFAIAVAILVASVVVLAYVIGKEEFAIWQAVGVIGALAGILLAVAGVTSLLSKSSVEIGKDGAKVNNLTTSLISIGAAILMLALTVKLIGSMSPEEAAQGFKGLGVMILSILGILGACRLLAKGDVLSTIDKVGKAFLAISAAMLIMVMVAKMIAKMEPEDMFKGAVGISALVGIITLLMLSTRTVGSNADKIGKTLMQVAVAMAILTVVAKMIAKMSWEDMGKAAAGLSGLVGIITGLMVATRLASGKEKKIGGTLMGVAAAMLMMALVIAIVGRMRPDVLKKGIIVVGLFGMIISGLIASTKLAGKQAGKLASTLLSVATAIGIIAAVAVLLGLVKTEYLARGIVAVALLGGIISGIIASTKNAKGCHKNIYAMSLAIALMAGAVYALSFLDPEKVKVISAAMSLMMGAFALMIKASGSAKKVKAQPFLVLAGVLLILGGIIVGLSFLKIDAGVIAAAAGIAILMATLSGALYALSGLDMRKLSDKKMKKLLVALIGLSAVMAVLGLVLAMMSALKTANAIPNAIALSILLPTMAAVLFLLTKMNVNLISALKGVVGLLAMAVPLLAFVGVLALMSNVKNAMPNAIVLITIAATMTALLLILVVIGALWIPALLGCLCLLATAVPMLAFVGILALMDKIQNAEANAQLLLTFMGTMVGLLVVLAAIGPMAIVGVTALTMLTGLMATIGLLVVAIGALVEKFPQLQTFLDTGLPLLEQLAGSLGTMLGKFVAGFTSEVMTVLPALGTCLSQFMTNATPFIDGVKTVDASVLAGVGILTGAILALTAAEVLNGIMTFIPGMGGLPALGTELSQFMMNAMPFIAGASMMNETALAGVRALADTILILTAANLIDGLASFITGGGALEKFGEQLPLLGQGLVGFSNSLGTFTEDQLATVNCAAQAVKTLASAASEIPNTGGLLGQLVGENGLGDFASQFPSAGTGLRGLLDTVGTFSEAEVATVNCVAEAIKTLASASSEIPNTGGLLGMIVGENGLGDFADQFPNAGTGLRGLLDNVGTFTEAEVETIKCVAESIKALASASSEIPNTGGLLARIVGDNPLDKFADQLPNVGLGIRGLLNGLESTFTEDEVRTVNCAADAILKFAQVSSEIPNEGGWLAKIVGDNPLDKFAEQLPNVGKGLRGFADELGTFDGAKLATVRMGVDALMVITNLANSDLKSAEKHFEGFGKALPALGTNLATFCNNMPASATSAAAVTSLNKILDSAKRIGDVNSNVFSTFADNLGRVSEDGVKKFVTAFTSESAKKDCETAAKTMATTLTTKLSDYIDDAKTSGINLGKGYVAGIESKIDDAYNMGVEIGKAAVKGVNDGQKSASPSKLAIQSGKWLGEGYVIGINKLGGQVGKAGSALGETATSTLSSSISKLADMVSSDIDTQPTIRPVLDLSDVQAGASALNGMLNMNSSIGVNTNLGAISSMMSTRSQNGATADLMSALDKLNKKMDNVGNTTYQINGITYDDGSNISAAVETLVRAARIERRV